MPKTPKEVAGYLSKRPTYFIVTTAYSPDEASLIGKCSVSIYTDLGPMTLHTDGNFHQGSLETANGWTGYHKNKKKAEQAFITARAAAT